MVTARFVPISIPPAQTCQPQGTQNNLKHTEACPVPASSNPLRLQKGHLPFYSHNPLSPPPFLHRQGGQLGWAMAPHPLWHTACSSSGTHRIPGSREVGYECCDGLHACAVTTMPFLSPRKDAPSLHGDQQHSWPGACPRLTALESCINTHVDFQDTHKGIPCASYAPQDKPEQREAVPTPKQSGHSQPWAWCCPHTPTSLHTEQHRSGFMSICSTVWVSAI